MRNLSNRGCGVIKKKIREKDGDWHIRLKLDSGQVADFDQSAKLAEQQLLVYVAPPETYTGTWISWYVNGQKVMKCSTRMAVTTGCLSTITTTGEKTSGAREKTSGARHAILAILLHKQFDVT